MRAPLILRPVVPVLNDIVDGYLTLAELSEGAFEFLLCLITLTTLPEAQHPLGIERGLASEGAIAGNHLIEVLASNEVIVHILSHLTPDAQLSTLFRTAGLGNTQATVGLTAIGLPFDAQLDALFLLQLDGELIGIGIPGRAPTLRHHFLTVDIHLDVASIIEDELEEIFLTLALTFALAVAGAAFAAQRLDKALVGNIGTSQLEALWQVLNATIIRL